MVREALSFAEIRELSEILRALFIHLEDVKRDRPLARFVKRFQVPPHLSESLTLRLLEEKHILSELSEFDFQLGNKIDIVARKEDKIKKIEVKATTEQAFQRLSKGDISADYLIWIHFDQFFSSSDHLPVHLFIVKNPGKYFTQVGQIMLDEFKNKVGDDLERVTIDLRSLS